MTATTLHPRSGDERAATGPPQGGTARRRPPGVRSTPARKRQAPWIALGLLLVFGAALAFAAWSRATSTKVPVLVVTRDLAAGETVTASALRTEQVQVGPGVPVVGPGAAPAIVGKLARGPIPAGTLVNRGMVTSGDVVPSRQAVVGAVLPAGAYPSASMRVGDRLQLVATAAASDRGLDVEPLGTGRVWAVSEQDGPGSTGLFVSILVPAERSADVANAAAQQRLRLVLVGTGA